MFWDERHYASPVSRDGFFYSPNRFYVEVERDRVERCDSSRLHYLLTYTIPPPLLTKAGKVAKRQPLPHKDENVQFYIGQLAHYGLKPLKTKDAAKRRLLEAFGTKATIEIPEKIRAIERELKREYQVADEVAKKKYQEEKRLAEIEEEKKRKKRKAEQEELMREFMEDDKIVGKGKKATKSKPKATSSKKLSKAELQKAISRIPKDRLRDIVLDCVDKIPELEKVFRKEVESSESNLESNQFSGKYQIVCPHLSDDWPDLSEDMWLKLSPSSTASHLWGSFDFGIMEGIIRASAPPVSHGSVSTFVWRGREGGEVSTITCGDDNKGTLTFLGNDKLRGTISGPWGDNIEFVGKKQEMKNVVWSRSVKSWKQAYRGYTDSAYDCENRGRWGGWGGEPEYDDPEDSDTTTGGRGRSFDTSHLEEEDEDEDGGDGDEAMEFDDGRRRGW